MTIAFVTSDMLACSKPRRFLRRTGYWYTCSRALQQQQRLGAAREQGWGRGTDDGDGDGCGNVDVGTGAGMRMGACARCVAACRDVGADVSLAHAVHERFMKFTQVRSHALSRCALGFMNDRVHERSRSRSFTKPVS